MKYRNLSIVFMIFMILGLITTFVLFFQLEASKGENVILDSELKDRNEALEKQNEALEDIKSSLEIEQGKYIRLKDSVDIICPQLSAIKDEIDNPTSGYSIGINYNTDKNVDLVQNYVVSQGNEVYFAKQSSTKESFIIYYNPQLKDYSEKLADDLGDLTSLKFTAIKGLTPSSLTAGAVEKTILIHIKN